MESLKLSISDQQLPMFIRIMQLGIALYYGEIGSCRDGEGEDLAGHAKDTLGNGTGECKLYSVRAICLLLTNINGQG